MRGCKDRCSRQLRFTAPVIGNVPESLRSHHGAPVWCLDLVPKTGLVSEKKQSFVMDTLHMALVVWDFGTKLLSTT